MHLDLAPRTALHLSTAALAAALLAASPRAQALDLQLGTGTFSQTCCLPPGETFLHPGKAIDDEFSALNGWSVFDITLAQPDTASAQTAAWEFVSDVEEGLLVLTLHSTVGSGHLIGRARFSVTDDPRTEFADGVPTNGDVTANWTVLASPVSVALPAGMTHTVLGDGSVLTGGTVADNGISTFVYSLPFGGVTGLRLEAMEDPSLPHGGPGHAANGNFDLTELQVAHLPADATLFGDLGAVSLAHGGTQTLTLSAGAAHAGRFYLVLGSLSGSSPGTPLGGPFVLPLNTPDAYFDFSLTMPNQGIYSSTFGVLDASGGATAQVSIPTGLTGGLVGLPLVHAFVAFDGAGLHLASNAMPLELVP